MNMRWTQTARSRRTVRWMEGAFVAASGLSMAVVVLLIAWIFIPIIYHGVGVISASFLLEAPREGMTSGGIFPAIFGTLSLVILMILAALPVGIASAIYLVEYAKDTPVSRLIKAGVNNLAGIPSIVFGLFGLGFFILFVGRNLDRVLATGMLFGKPALIWAAMTLAILVLPVVIVATEEALRAVPWSYREAAYALGATQWQTTSRVVLPQARPGILTGAILSVSRGAGETAPILFTGAAYFLPRLPVVYLDIPWTPLRVPILNPFDQFMELAYHIYIMATQSIDVQATRPIQYGTTLVLLLLTFFFNLSAIFLRSHYRKQLKSSLQ